VWLTEFIRYLTWLGIALLVVLVLLTISQHVPKQEDIDQPVGHRLFHHWFKGDWIHNRVFRTEGGTYLFLDKRQNVGVLAVLRQPGVRPWIRESTEREATLFPDTPFETHMTPSANSLIILCPDLSTHEYAIAPGDAEALSDTLMADRERPLLDVVIDHFDNRIPGVRSSLAPYRANDGR